MLISQVEASGYALVVSTENITQNWYPGNNRSMLIPNTLFRMGAAAMVLTNKRSARYYAKYQLQKVYRVHLGADDNAFRCGSGANSWSRVLHGVGARARVLCCGTRAFMAWLCVYSVLPGACTACSLHQLAS